MTTLHETCLAQTIEHIRGRLVESAKIFGRPATLADLVTTDRLVAPPISWAGVIPADDFRAYLLSDDTILAAGVQS